MLCGQQVSFCNHQRKFSTSVYSCYFVRSLFQSDLNCYGYLRTILLLLLQWFFSGISCISKFSQNFQYERNIIGRYWENKIFYFPFIYLFHYLFILVTQYTFGYRIQVILQDQCRSKFPTRGSHVHRNIRHVFCAFAILYVFLWFLCFCNSYVFAISIFCDFYVFAILCFLSQYFEHGFPTKFQNGILSICLRKLFRSRSIASIILRRKPLKFLCDRPRLDNSVNHEKCLPRDLKVIFRSSLYCVTRGKSL